MAPRYITALFTDGGLPKVGILPVPTINIWDVATNALIVNADNMVDMGGGGWYKYLFAAYDPTKDYTILCDGGVVLQPFERYKEGTNFLDEGVDPVKVDTNNIRTVDVPAIEADIAVVDAKLVVIKTGVKGTDNIFDVVTNTAISIDDIHAIETGKWRIVANQMIFYDPFGVPLFKFNLKDAAGNPTMVNVYERDPTP